MVMERTSQNTGIETSEPVIQQLLSQVVVERLLRAIVWFVARTRRPVALVEGEGHDLPLGCASRGSLRTSRSCLGGLKDRLVSLHPYETFRATRNFYSQGQLRACS